MNMFICIFICVYMFIWVCAYSTCFILFNFNHTFYFSVYFWFTVTLYFQARLVCLYRSFILGTLYVCTCFPMPFFALVLLLLRSNFWSCSLTVVMPLKCYILSASYVLAPLRSIMASFYFSYLFYMREDIIKLLL